MSNWLFWARNNLLEKLQDLGLSPKEIGQDYIVSQIRCDRTMIVHLQEGQVAPCQSVSPGSKRKLLIV